MILTANSLVSGRSSALSPTNAEEAGVSTAVVDSVPELQYHGNALQFSHSAGSVYGTGFQVALKLCIPLVVLSSECASEQGLAD